MYATTPDSDSLLQTSLLRLLLTYSEYFSPDPTPYMANLFSFKNPQQAEKGKHQNQLVTNQSPGPSSQSPL